MLFDMAAPTSRVAVSFTGGKDCTLVLHLLQLLDSSNIVTTSAATGHKVVCLVTFVPKDSTRPFKAHPVVVVEAQARALGLPHRVFEVAEPYLESYQTHIASLRQELGVDALATGDIEDVCSGFMRRAVAGTSVRLCTPLWQLPRAAILSLAWQVGLKPVITCTHLPKFSTNNSTLIQHCKAQLCAIDAPRDEGDTLNSAAAPHANLDASSPRATSLLDGVVGSLLILREAGSCLEVAAGGTDAAPVVPGGSDMGAMEPSAAVCPVKTAARVRAAAAAPGGGPPCSSALARTAQQVEALAKGNAGSCPAAGGGEQGAEVALLEEASSEMGELLVGAVLSPRLHTGLLQPLGKQLGVDAGGEFGEYHTMVLDGPLFQKAVRMVAVRRVEGEFCYLDVESVELVAKE